jgi:hypothetical protein
MNDKHPITPPLELVQQCWDELRNQTPLLNASTAWDKAIALAYQAGADQELEACCGELRWRGAASEMIKYLRTARRPRPPSLKEQALEALEQLLRDPEAGCFSAAPDTLRRALEALPDA